VKVEPAFRPDGTRALRGGGIYPGGRQRLPGADSGLWNALNHRKHHVDLDLREAEQRDAFVELASGSDVLVESFSPRVMENLGIPSALSSREGPRPTHLSMPAFPPGPRRQWVSYGTGVHALIGLGDGGGGRFLAPAVSYPDPIAGFTATFAMLCAIVARDRGVVAELVEVSLFAATLPLLALAVPGMPFGPTGKPGIGRVLLDSGRARGEFVALEVAGLMLDHPRGPIRPASS
jgi:crotonobetainyl-CoA:carnitine CoA-transferase CaiB-like acyl-CoA transferase